MPIRPTRKDGAVHVAGLGAALLASALFNVGIVLQAVDARVAPRELGYRLGLLGRLFRRPRWVLGFALGIVGIAPQVVAYSRAPFVVVQPTLAVGLLLVLALGVYMLGESVTIREVAGVIAIIGGIALVAWGAPPHSESHRGGIALIAVVALLAVGGLAPFAVRGTRLDTGMLAILAAGFGFGATNVATKLFGDDFQLGHYGNATAWGVVGVVMGVAAQIANMTAFQRRAATTVVPISTSVQTFLPIMLEPFFLREHWASADYYGVPIAAGVVIALVGNVLISGTRAVSEVIAEAG
jgi:drug/metabolite transporter (DMT)-like permease